MFEQELAQQLEVSNNTNDVIPWELTLFNSGAMSVEEVIELYDVSLDFNTALVFVSVGIAIILASTFIPIWYVVKLEPKDILVKSSIG